MCNGTNERRSRQGSSICRNRNVGVSIRERRMEQGRRRLLDRSWGSWWRSGSIGKKKNHISPDLTTMSERLLNPQHGFAFPLQLPQVLFPCLDLPNCISLLMWDVICKSRPGLQSPGPGDSLFWLRLQAAWETGLPHQPHRRTCLLERSFLPLI